VLAWWARYDLSAPLVEATSLAHHQTPLHPLGAACARGSVIVSVSVAVMDGLGNDPGTALHALMDCGCGCGCDDGDGVSDWDSDCDCDCDCDCDSVDGSDCDCDCGVGVHGCDYGCGSDGAWGCGFGCGCDGDHGTDRHRHDHGHSCGEADHASMARSHHVAPGQVLVPCGMLGAVRVGRHKTGCHEVRRSIRVGVGPGDCQTQGRRSHAVVDRC